MPPRNKSTKNPDSVGGEGGKSSSKRSREETFSDSDSSAPRARDSSPLIVRQVRLDGGADVVDDDPDIDWRQEMRSEIRAAVADAMNSQRFSSAPNSTEIDASDVIMETEPVSEVMKRIETENRSNKMAIRLASIGKEGNKQQFLDMVDIRSHLEIADHAFKNPEKLSWDDIHIVKEAVSDAIKLIDSRMDMIEKIDKHPLSWPVATEFQKLKRSKTCDAEDEKLFIQAEKKVTEDRKQRQTAQKEASSSTPKPYSGSRPFVTRPFRPPFQSSGVCVNGFKLRGYGYQSLFV